MGGHATPLPGEFQIAVSESSPAEVASSVHRFLDEVLPAHVATKEEQEQARVTATVFIDYVPLHIEVCISADDTDATVATFKHPSRCDVIRFRQIVDRFVSFLQSSDMKVTTVNQAVASALPGLVDDDFFDDDSGDDLSWSERVELVLSDTVSPRSSVREQAFQCLARWAELAPTSHVAVAQGFTKYASQILLTLLSGPLSEMYPAASTLRNVACGTSPEACKILSNSPIFPVLASLQVSGLPPLVARNFTMALQSLRKVPDRDGRSEQAGIQKLNQKLPVADLASNSTRCTDLDSVTDFGGQISNDSDGSGNSEKVDNSTTWVMKSEDGAFVDRVKKSMLAHELPHELPLQHHQFLELADNLWQSEGSNY